MYIKWECYVLQVELILDLMQGRKPFFFFFWLCKDPEEYQYWMQANGLKCVINKFDSVTLIFSHKKSPKFGHQKKML